MHTRKKVVPAASMRRVQARYLSQSTFWRQGERLLSHFLMPVAVARSEMALEESSGDVEVGKAFGGSIVERAGGKAVAEGMAGMMMWEGRLSRLRLLATHGVMSGVVGWCGTEEYEELAVADGWLGGLCEVSGSGVDGATV